LAFSGERIVGGM
jgi:hypothetical protein